MQAGRIITRQLEAEAEGVRIELEGEGHAPAVLGFAAKLQAAIAKRERRAADRTCAAIAPRDERGRFA